MTVMIVSGFLVKGLGHDAIFEQKHFGSQGLGEINIWEGKFTSKMALKLLIA